MKTDHRPAAVRCWEPATKLLAIFGALLLTLTACSSGRSTTARPTTTVVHGKTLFIIYPPGPCPQNEDCPAEVTINNKVYQYPNSLVPKSVYRSGPLYAVGPQAEAHLIPSVSTPNYQILALRLGTIWVIAFSPGLPSTDTVQRQICQLEDHLSSDNLCVTHLGPSSR